MYGLRRLAVAGRFPPLRGYLNPAELLKAALGAAGYSTLAALLVAVLQATVDHAGAIFPDPSVAAPVAFVLGHALELYRRLGHGVTPDAVVARPPS